jgi:chaperonin GroES
MIKPTGDNILIEIIEVEEEDSGIILPDGVGDNTDPDRALVVEVGPGRINREGRRIEPIVEPGDVILIANYSGHTIKEDGTNYVLAKQRDILGIIK